MADIVVEIRRVLSAATPAPWRPGKTGDSVVSDKAAQDVTPEDRRFYGGWLVAESMGAGDKALIIAAPDLLQRAADEIERLRSQRAAHLQADLQQIEEDKAVLRQQREQHYDGPWKPGERIP